MRRKFTVLQDANVNQLVLKLHHDDNIEVYLNGEKVYSFIGWTDDFKFIPIENKLKTGRKCAGYPHVPIQQVAAWLDAGLVDGDYLIIPVRNIMVAEQQSVDVNATQTSL